MLAPRRTSVIAGCALLLAVTASWLLGHRDPAGAQAPAAESFQASDLALIGHTDLPQLVEFYHPG
jgi:hypothetical protein